MTTHPSEDILSDFVAGQLDEGAVPELLTHLVECEVCLARVDGLWSQTAAGLGLSPGVEPTPERSDRQERSLFNRIHRAAFVAEAVRLSTQGSLVVLAALLRPLAGLGRSPGEKGESKKW